VSSDGDQPGSAGAAGAVRWLTMHDDLLRGLAHAISNRLATISAASAVLDAATLPDARFVRGLQEDAGRLEGLLELLRLLPRHADAALEPMLLGDALDRARLLVEHHPAMRDRLVVADSVGNVMPVRAEPTSVVHAACVLLLAAGRHATPGTPLTAQLETMGDVVRLTVRGSHAGETLREDTGDEVGDEDADAIRWLLAASGGQAAVDVRGGELTLPTLQASRRR
jgi:hypothetical protein